MHAATGTDDRELARQTAPDLVDGQEVPRLAQTLFTGLEVELEDIARHAFRLVERGRVDPAQLAEIA